MVCSKLLQITFCSPPSLSIHSQKPRQPRPIRSSRLSQFIHTVSRKINRLARVTTTPTAHTAILLVTVQRITQGHRARKLAARGVGRALLEAVMAVGEVAEVMNALWLKQHADCQGMDSCIAPLSKKKKKKEPWSASHPYSRLAGKKGGGEVGGMMNGGVG